MSDERSTAGDTPSEASPRQEATAGTAETEQATITAPAPEELWSGDFGDAYVERNADLDTRRAGFWQALLADLPVQTVLEIGCGQGGNLVPLARLLPARQIWGIDVNETALARARQNAPGTNPVYALARALPFRDGAFDLVYTTGVLIHQPDEDLLAVTDEIVRVSGRFILCGEYHADEPVELAYRGWRGALFKRDYGRLYAERYPSLAILRTGYLGPEDGFDRLTYQVFEKASGG